MQCEVFQGTMIGWSELFQKAADYASKLGPRCVRRISHSASGGRGIVAVWYEPDQESDEPVASEQGSTGFEESVPIRLCFEFHEGTLIGWRELFELVLPKAAQLAPEQLVSYSHSDDSGKGLVVLWYWGA